jgi:prevent-host-death family protein
MRLEGAIQSVSYLKAHAADLIDELGRKGEPLIVTQNGKARLVVQDIASFERTQETMALLKLLAQGRKEMSEGKAVSAEDGFRKMRSRLRVCGKGKPA